MKVPSRGVEFRRLVALWLVVALAAAPTLAQSATTAPPAPNAPAAPATPAAPAAPAPPAAEDIGWPREITREDATLVYYQPQVDAWNNYQLIEARMAFALTPRGGQEVLGVATLTANTVVDNETRTAVLRNVAVKSVRFPSLDAATAGQFERLFRSLIPSNGETIAVDRVMAMMEQDKVPARAVALKNEPPTIFYSASPAILLLVDGEPVFAPIDKTNLEFVVNTNWDLFRDKSDQAYFLLGPSGWLTSKALNGPWTATTKLPDDFTKLPDGENFDDVKKAIPARASGAAPQVFFSKGPAELLLLRGSPVYSRISGTQLLYVTNTDNDIFVDNTTRQFFVLLSGRWFRADTLGGPFAYAGDKLPADFTKIPKNSPKANVLASVPGTQEAADAVMLAQIPTTAVVNRKQAEAEVKVSYDGKPQFAPVEQTSLKYATNTPDKVIQVGDLYYLCFQGVWFVSRSPNGPWKTADSIPQAIYTIPPSSPVYNVTYVTQTNPTPTTVECSHTGGYFGMFVFGAAVGFAIAFGTGYYYPPYIYRPPGAYYPIYRPWPVTYGVGAVYNPRTGAYGVGRAVYGPYGAAGGSAWYNPSTGRYGRSASVQTPYGGRTAAAAYNPWTGGYARTSQGHNAYSQWGSTVATRGNQWVQTGHVTNSNGTVAGYRTSSGQSGVAARGANGTVVKSDNGVYAGRDGNVYKRNGQGDWSQYDNGQWNQVDRSAAERQGLDGAANARQRGDAQAEQYRSRDAARGGTSRPASGGSAPRATPTPAGGGALPSTGAARGGGRGGGGRRR
jgi:hypothetical protein